MKATCWHCRTPTTFHQELLVHMIVVCLIRIAMLEASQLAKVCVGHLSFARALTETRLFFQLMRRFNKAVVNPCFWLVGRKKLWTASLCQVKDCRR
jgi:hypothetical protein